MQDREGSHPAGHPRSSALPGGGAGMKTPVMCPWGPPTSFTRMCSRVTRVLFNIHNFKSWRSPCRLRVEAGPSAELWGPGATAPGTVASARGAHGPRGPRSPLLHRRRAEEGAAR